MSVNRLRPVLLVVFFMNMMGILMGIDFTQTFLLLAFVSFTVSFVMFVFLQSRYKKISDSSSSSESEELQTIENLLKTHPKQMLYSVTPYAFIIFLNLSIEFMYR